MLLHSGIPIPFYSMNGSKQRMIFWLYSVSKARLFCVCCDGLWMRFESDFYSRYCLMVKGVNCYPLWSAFCKFIKYVNITFHMWGANMHVSCVKINAYHVNTPCLLFYGKNLTLWYVNCYIWHANLTICYVHMLLCHASFPPCSSLITETFNYLCNMFPILTCIMLCDLRILQLFE